ncbi:MAG: mono/diheme cytochrome c family protein [Verrucomicrobiales bacterium]|jgi:mono/diheme cytochrome c family protein
MPTALFVFAETWMPNQQLLGQDPVENVPAFFDRYDMDSSDHRWIEPSFLSIRMHRPINFFVSLFALFAIADVVAEVTVESDTEAPFGDAELSVQVADDDLLTGAAFVSSLPMQNGTSLTLTDGVGSEEERGRGTFGQNDTSDWVITFSSLRITELHELRVFSCNGDARAIQDYDVSFSSDRGKTFTPLAKDVIADQSMVYNLTRVPVKVGCVTDLRFTFRNPGDRERDTNTLHSAIYEIDAIGVPWIPPSLAEVREAGRLKSSFLNAQFTSAKAAEAPGPDLETFREEIQQLLASSCVECHGPDKQKGKFRVDTLNPDLQNGGDVDWWLEVQNVLSNHEMPPEDEDVELADADRAKLIDWLSSEVQVASQVRRAEAEHTSFRRMTRYEYTNTMQDLLGLPYEFGEDLPPETASEDGFRNSSEMLQISAMQFEYYRNLARTALEKATFGSEQPPIQWFAFEFEKPAARDAADLENRLAQAIGKGGNPNLDAIRARAKARPFSPWYRFTETGKLVAANGLRSQPPSEVRPEWPDNPAVQLILTAPESRERRRPVRIDLGKELPDEGILRVRVRASRHSAEIPEIPVLQLAFGFGSGNNAVMDEAFGELSIEAIPDSPGIYQWDLPLSELTRNPIRKEPPVNGRTPNERISFTNVYPTPAEPQGLELPAIRIDHIEVSTPAFDQWPPESHRRIFVDSDNAEDETKYAREILTQFLSRAWRRPVGEDELSRMTALIAEFRPQCEDFQEAIIEVLAVALASPRFLYIVQEGPNDETLTSYELASRLSYFLWCSMPDEELLDLAASQQLLEPDVLAKQTKRMLADPRSRRMSEQFVHQWLNMELLDFLTVDAKTHPTFDPDLKAAMAGEIVAFFEEILKNDQSALDFIDSDFAVINQRLAQHYGIPDVHGDQFRRVALRQKDGRGGLLTQGGVLAMTSNGVDSNPLRRGIWLLENLLNDPPPPPPPAVPEIDVADPEIAKLTLKQRLEDHRNDPACMSCHQRIDPWGIAFENFDAIGNWRGVVANQPVDSTSVLFNGEPLDGMDGLKRYLFENRQDQFAQALVHKMTTFALGRPLSFADRAHTQRITAKFRREDDRLVTLIELIVQSEIFQSR